MKQTTRMKHSSGPYLQDFLNTCSNFCSNLIVCVLKGYISEVAKHTKFKYYFHQYVYGDVETTAKEEQET